MSVKEGQKKLKILAEKIYKNTPLSDNEREFLSAALTQILHNYLGYITYKNRVFKREGKPFAYILLVILSWAMQTLILKTIINLGFSFLFAVAITIPLLAIFSFITQKLIIFK